MGPAGTLGYMTIAVQLGFIAGTLVFAFFAISDRVRRATFLVCSLPGAASNLGYMLLAEASLLLPARFATGFFLAGIYPVGMKIASGWYRTISATRWGSWSAHWSSAPRSLTSSRGSARRCRGRR